MKRLTKAKALLIKPGSLVNLDPSYNKGERPPNKILTPTEALSVREAGGCQTGVLIAVKTQSGSLVELDAGWFKA